MKIRNALTFPFATLALIALVACVPGPDPHIWYVATTGNNSNDCHTPATACLTLEAASDKAVDGDTIFIMVGDYFETDALDPDVSVVVDKDLTIEGVGAVKLDGDGKRTVMSVLPGINLTIRNLVLFNGSGENAGGLLVDNGAVVSIFDSSVSENLAVGTAVGPGVINAGGIHNRGVLTLKNVEVSFNKAELPAGNHAYGGGIYNQETLTMSNCQVSMNTSEELGSGIYNESGATAAINDTIIQDNFAAGGVYNLGHMTLTDSHVYRNNTNSYDYCGGITNFDVLEMTGGVVADNAAPDYYAGICNLEPASNAIISGTQILQNVGSGVINYGSMDLTDVTVSEHIQTGIFNYETMSLTHGTVTLNLSPKGGGIWNVRGEMTIKDSTISENEASMWGGGLMNNADAILTIEGSTLSGNTATARGGGIYQEGGGTIGGLTMVNSTVSGNHAPEGAGIANNGEALLKFVTVSGNSSHGISNVNIGVTRMLSSIIADNAVADCFGTGFSTLGHNLDSDNTCGLNPVLNDIPGTAPLLDPLAANGGPTLTHALMSASPAVDAGAAGADCPASDQRGVARPQGVQCDIGAFELEEGLIGEGPQEPQAPTSTPTPKPEDEGESTTARAIMNANCREGPHKDYRVTGSLMEGESAQVDGRNEDGTWLWIVNPSAYGHCWVAGSTVEFTGDILALTVIVPSELPAPEPEGCYVYAQTSADLICVAPCPDGAEPGDPCTPED
ncbi:MAG: right-handed parallel beta-helix repeat-containing protein [Anaerolineales bacterium]